MALHSSRRRLAAGLLLGIVAAAGGTALLSRNDRTPASPASTTEAEATEPGSSNEQPPDDMIEFPKDQWPAAGLQVQTVSRGTLDESIELTGKVSLNEDRLAHIFPLVEGRVDEVKVRFGQQVRQGELLVVVQSKEVGQGMLQLFQDRLKLEFAEVRNRWTQSVVENTSQLIRMIRERASVDEIEAAMKERVLGDNRERLVSAYVAFLRADGHLKRLAPLGESGAVPARQILEAESDLNAARAGLQSLLEQIGQDIVQEARLSEQSVKELQTAIAVSETNLRILGFEAGDLEKIIPAEQGEAISHYPVRSPFDGTVISKDVVLLERVGPEQQILTIADLSTVWVTADVYESHLPLLESLANQTVQVRCDAWPGQRFEARIFYTGDVVQETTRTIALRAVAKNPERKLKPGMFVTVELPSLESAPVFQVPPGAIQDHEGRSFVFVQTGEEAFVRRDVVVGRRSRDAVELRSGVQESDRVVITGGFALKSQMLADLLAE